MSMSATDTHTTPTAFLATTVSRLASEGAEVLLAIPVHGSEVDRNGRTRTDDTAEAVVAILDADGRAWVVEAYANGAPDDREHFPTGIAAGEGAIHRAGWAS